MELFEDQREQHHWHRKSCHSLSGQLSPDPMGNCGRVAASSAAEMPVSPSRVVSVIRPTPRARCILTWMCRWFSRDRNQAHPYPGLPQ